MEKETGTPRAFTHPPAKLINPGRFRGLFQRLRPYFPTTKI
jgi:hypothetical protein